MVNCSAQHQFTTVPNSYRGESVSRARETKVTLPCSQDQKAELEQRAQEQGLSIANYLRSLLGWPLEQQGSRKDLIAKPTSSPAEQSDAPDGGASGHV